MDTRSRAPNGRTLAKHRPWKRYGTRTLSPIYPVYSVTYLSGCSAHKRREGAVTTNYLRVTNGFDILTKALAPYVAGELRARYGDEWWDQGVLRFLSADQKRDLPPGGEDDELTAALDAGRSLNLINVPPLWNDLFQRKLSREHRAWVNELIPTRNKWAHKGLLDMADDDAWRALDTMTRLVEQIDAGAADRLRALARIVRYGAEGPSTMARNAGEAPRPRGTSQEAREIPEEISALPTKSAKIRALDAEGWSRSDIARALGIRYQHVRNVLVTPLKRGS